MAASGEAVCVDGLATRVQQPRGWDNQKVLYDCKRRAHTAQGLSVSTTWGDLLWIDGGWPGSCHEHELLALAGLDQALGDVEGGLSAGPWVPRAGQDARALAYPGRGPAHQGSADRRPAGVQPSAGGAARAVEQSIAHLANAWALRRWRGLLYRVRDVYRAAGALICLGRWLHRIPK
jgi:hypothetical protein